MGGRGGGEGGVDVQGEVPGGGDEEGCEGERILAYIQIRRLAAGGRCLQCSLLYTTDFTGASCALRTVCSPVSRFILPMIVSTFHDHVVFP